METMDREQLLPAAPDAQFRREYLATFCRMKGWTHPMVMALFGRVDGISGKGPANTIAWSEIQAAMYALGYTDSLVQRFGVELNNAAELMGQADVDGCLVGGASLKAEDFVPIIQAAV